MSENAKNSTNRKQLQIVQPFMSMKKGRHVPRTVLRKDGMMATVRLKKGLTSGADGPASGKAAAGGAGVAMVAYPDGGAGRRRAFHFGDVDLATAIGQVQGQIEVAVVEIPSQETEIRERHMTPARAAGLKPAASFSW